jgi:DNA-binding NarL/FixJ family response regulator
VSSSSPGPDRKVSRSRQSGHSSSRGGSDPAVARRDLQVQPVAVVALAQALQAGAEDHVVVGARGVQVGDGPLTAREQEIADLIAGGRTNRDVAEQLVVSPRTIEAHLRNIYAKLGVRSRVELARDHQRRI